MSLKKLLLKNTGINLAGYFYLLLASFFSIPLLLGSLGRDVFGVYVLLVSLISLSAVFDFGIATAVIRKLSLPNITSEEKILVWKTSFAIFVFLSFVLSVCLFVLIQILANTLPVLSLLDRNTLNWSALVLSGIVFINHLNIHLLTLPQSEQRFDVYNTKTFIVGTGNTVASALTAIIFQSVSMILSVQLAFHLITFIIMFIYARNHYSGNNFYPSYHHKTGKELLSFGLRNFVATLSGQIENQFSNLILGAMVSAKAITSFSIPQSIVAKGAGVVSQFAQAFFPLSTSLLEKNRISKLKKMILSIESITLLGGILAVILSFTIGQQFLMWWLKDPVVVEAAYPILKILSFYFVLVSLTPVPTALLQGLNKPQIPSFFGALTVSLEIILSLYFIRLGAIGIAYAFLVSVCITVPPILVVTWKQLNKEIARLTAVN